MIEQLARARFIVWKDLRTYYLKPPLISWGILFPASMILAFYLRNPNDFRGVVPGLIGLTLLFGATSMEAIVIAFEKRVGEPWSGWRWLPSRQGLSCWPSRPAGCFLLSLPASLSGSALRWR